MAKGSVRKKGKKWYYRFYVEDASGKMVQKEYAGTESKSETEKLLRKALEDYEDKKFVAKADNLTVGELLDMWAEEELKTGTLSNGTVENYLGAIRCIKSRRSCLLSDHTGGAGKGGRSAVFSNDLPSRTSSLASSPIQPSSGSGVAGRNPTACR